MKESATPTAPGKARLITLQQASAEYGPPYTSLRDLVRRGHLASVQLGDARRIWVRRADIELLIDRSLVPIDSMEPLTTRPVR